MAMGMIKSSKMGASEAATKLNFIPLVKKDTIKLGFRAAYNDFSTAL